MTIKLTREEWLEARDRVRTSSVVTLNESQVHSLTTAVLGLCPPEPPPVGWRAGDRGLGTLLVHRDANGSGVWVGFPSVQHAMLTPDEAVAMAKALVEHAEYVIDAREQERS